VIPIARSVPVVV